MYVFTVIMWKGLSESDLHKETKPTKPQRNLQSSALLAFLCWETSSN